MGNRRFYIYIAGILCRYCVQLYYTIAISIAERTFVSKMSNSMKKRKGHFSVKIPQCDNFYEWPSDLHNI